MTRSISQNTQNDLRVLKWNIQRPDNTGGRPQLLNKAIKSLMKRMIILGRLKSNVEVVGYFKAICPRLTYNTILNALKSIYSKPDKKERCLFCQQNTGKHAWIGYLLIDTGLLTTGERLSSLRSRKSTFGALMDLNSIGVCLEANYNFILRFQP